MNFEKSVIRDEEPFFNLFNVVESVDKFLSVRDVNRKIIWCSVCKTDIKYKGNISLDRHVKTQKHVYNVNLNAETSTDFINSHEFITDLVRAFVAAKIPVTVLANPQLKAFLEKYCKRKILDESTIRLNYLTQINNEKNVHTETNLEYQHRMTVDETDPAEKTQGNVEISSINNSEAENSFVDSDFLENEETITQVGDVNTEMEVIDYSNSIPNTDEPQDIKPITFVKIESHVVDNEPQLKNVHKDDAEVKLETQNNCNKSPRDCKQHYDIDVKDELQSNLLRANYTNILISTQTVEMKAEDILSNSTNSYNPTDLNILCGNSSEVGVMVHTAGSRSINEQEDDSIHTGGKSNDCAMCGRSCTSLSSFMIHKRNQIVEQLYICDGCEPETRDGDLESQNNNKYQGSLSNAASSCNTSEIKIPSGNNSVTVGVNHSESSTSADQRKNNPSHTDGITSYNCDLCGQSCRSLYSLVVHKRSHTGKPSHMSDIRHHSQPVTPSIVAYKQIHTGGKYVCCVCDRVFKYKHALIGHKRGHAAEKPYVCDVCHKGYLDLSGLVKHQRIHTTDKPHVYDFSEGSYRLLQ